MAHFLINFSFNCYWLFTIFAAVKHVNSAGGVQQQGGDKPHSPKVGDQPIDADENVSSAGGLQQDADKPHAPKGQSSAGGWQLLRACVLQQNGKGQSSAQIGAIYPLSKEQVEHGLNQEIMDARMTSKNTNSKVLDIFRFEGEMWKSLPKLLKYTMERSIKILDRTDLMEILISTTDEQKDDMELYAKFCNRMSERIGATNSFGILMWHLCIENRDLSAEYDDITIQKYDDMQIQETARKIGKYLAAKAKSGMSDANDDHEIGKILAKTDYAQLRQIFEQKTDEMTIREQLNAMTKKMMNSQLMRLIDFMVTDVLEGRPHLFARLLHEKLRKLDNRSIFHDGDARGDVVRILVSRAHIDLPDIVDAYPGKADGLIKELEDIEAKRKGDEKGLFQDFIKIVKLVKTQDWMKPMAAETAAVELQ